MPFFGILDLFTHYKYGYNTSDDVSAESVSGTAAWVTGEREKKSKMHSIAENLVLG